jgi:hypothetical protein
MLIMFIGRRVGHRWFFGGNASLGWLLMYALMGGLVLYSILTKVTL